MIPGRFYAVILDKHTGTHQLLTSLPVASSKCLEICQNLGPVAAHTEHILFKCHADSGEEKK